MGLKLNLHHHQVRYNKLVRKFFELCPVVLNNVQHIFPGGAKNFLGWDLSPPPWLRACIQFCISLSRTSTRSLNLRQMSVMACILQHLDI